MSDSLNVDRQRAFQSATRKQVIGGVAELTLRDRRSTIEEVRGAQARHEPSDPVADGRIDDQIGGCRSLNPGDRSKP